jgi:hypothetical protein
MLISLVLFVFALNNYSDKAVQNIETFELEEKALLIADSFAKNFDKNNTLLGACIYDSDKKRVKTNEISSVNIQNSKSVIFGNIFVKSITYTKGSETKTLTLSTKNSVDCISAKRFVLIDGEKAIIQILTCREG